MPDRPPKAFIQIAHGRGEHGGRYRPFAEALAGAGYGVYVPDHRGHGPSARDAGQLGDFGPRGFSAVVDDMAIVSREIRRRHPGQSVLLFGHSMGSFAAQYYLLDHSDLIDALALCGTAAVDLRNPGKSGALAMDFLAGLENPRTDADWLSRDDRVVDAYLADPLCGFGLTPASQASMYADAERTADADSYRGIRRDLPIVLITGDRDPVNRFLAWFEPLAARYRAFGFTDVSTHVYGGARHEPLNELNRHEVFTNLIAWFDRVTERPVC
ncbi:MAG: alpha/beta hydrolase [Burkholderiaceae bacterium]